jgi:hypothetical protein
MYLFLQPRLRTRKEKKIYTFLSEITAKNKTNRVLNDKVSFEKLYFPRPGVSVCDINERLDQRINFRHIQFGIFGRSSYEVH